MDPEGAGLSCSGGDRICWKVEGEARVELTSQGSICVLAGQLPGERSRVPAWPPRVGGHTRGRLVRHRGRYHVLGKGRAFHSGRKAPCSLKAASRRQEFLGMTIAWLQGKG